MKINSLNILRSVRELGGDVNLAQVEEVIESFDITPFVEKERARYRIELWDKTSTVNGITPEQITSRDDYPAGGEVYFIYKDDNLVFIQPHNPFQAGFVPMTEEEALAIAAAQVEQMVDAEAQGEVEEAIIRHILLNM